VGESKWGEKVDLGSNFSRLWSKVWAHGEERYLRKFGLSKVVGDPSFAEAVRDGGEIVSGT